MPDALEERLSALAADLQVPVPDGLERAVMDRVARTRPRRRWRRWLAGLVAGLLGVGVVASPVGAEIRGWLGLPGVSVTSGDPVTETPTVPPAPGTPDLERAERLAGFTPVVPAELGAPDGVEVSADRQVVSLSWTAEDGTVRLDELRGDVEPIFWKTADQAERVLVAGTEALWLPTAHRVTVVPDGGSVRDLPSRLAGPTLLWLDGDLTLRLEGDLDLAEATQIAESGRLTEPRPARRCIPGNPSRGGAMRRILAVAVLALAAAVGLPAASHAGGPTSVLITQPGQSAGALYYDDAAYDALLGLLPADETRGEPLAPGGAGDDYNLTWMVHDVMPWRFDRVHVAPDGTAWVMHDLLGRGRRRVGRGRPSRRSSRPC